MENEIKAISVWSYGAFGSITKHREFEAPDKTKYAGGASTPYESNCKYEGSLIHMENSSITEGEFLAALHDMEGFSLKKVPFLKWV